jgi:hypothetical protein
MKLLKLHKVSLVYIVTNVTKPPFWSFESLQDERIIAESVRKKMRYEEF